MAKTEVTLKLTPDEHRLVCSAVEEAITSARSSRMGAEAIQAREGGSEPRIAAEQQREAELTFLLEKL